jgi:hypothetical protein
VAATLTKADRLLRGDADVAAELAGRLIVPLNNNFVVRPWGGSRMLGYKAIATLPDSIAASGQPVGEAFEISAYDADAEAERYPSIVSLSDGSEIELPDLLAANGPALLGDAFVERYGACMPLLPKTLDVKELLSVQGHPPGNTEVYVIIDADPGASIRLGFSMDVDAGPMREELVLGRREQAELLQLFAGGPAVAADIQATLAPWFAVRGASADAVATTIGRRLESVSDWPAARVLLERIKRLYWRVLDSLNELPVSPGQVIYNATPSRLVAAAGAASAEVHALGNPECREILALEIRRPGPTFRAWDNVRFPIRDIDIDAALGALNLQATSPDEFVVFPELVPGRPGIYCSVDSPAFRIEHLRPGGSAGDRVEVPGSGPHCLHAIGGAVEFLGRNGRAIGRLRKGESALVPVGVGDYAVTAARSAAEVVKVDLPLQ